MDLTSDQLAAATGCSAERAAQIVDELTTVMEHYAINTPQRVAMFLACGAHESAHFTKLEENLNYSAARLCAVWQHRFPTLAHAMPYEHNPRALANFVYGGRMGNTDPDDGWNYRGRGYGGLTGKDNYAAAGDSIGQDLVANPDFAATDTGAAWTLGWFWDMRKFNDFADNDDFEGIIAMLNVGNASEKARHSVIGMSERTAALAVAQDALA